MLPCRKKAVANPPLLIRWMGSCLDGVAAVLARTNHKGNLKTLARAADAQRNRIAGGSGTEKLGIVMGGGLPPRRQDEVTVA